MGNTLASPDIDFRTERVMRTFALPMPKVEDLWKIYSKHAVSADGKYLMKHEFFDLIQYKETCLTDHIFKLVGTKSDQAMNFGEFVEVITTFSCFERKELLKYFFFVLDPMRTGIIDKNELKHFVHDMWEGQIYQNITDALDYLDEIDDGDGLFNFKQVLQMESLFPMTMYPLLRLQVSMIRYTLGDRWWEAHKADLADARRTALIVEEQRLRSAHKALAKQNEVVSDDMIRHRLGWKYYLMPWLRAREKTKIMRVVAMEDDLDLTFNTKFSRGSQ